MRLERATTRSSEAALAGWISSNDVTLFTTVMVVAIAIFLHARLTKGARQQAQLVEEKASISATLDATAADLAATEERLHATTGKLDATNERLATTSQRLDATARDLDEMTGLFESTDQRLASTQAERDALQHQLNQRLADLAALNSKLDGLLVEKGRLETERRELTVERRTLAADRDSLTASNSTLRERLDAISGQLADKIAALAEVEKERDRLKAQAEELGSIVDTLRSKLDSLNIEIVGLRDQTEAERAAAAAQVEELTSRVAASDRSAEEYLAELKRATALLQGLRLQKQELERTITEVERRRQEELLEEVRNNRELIGLKGPLKRVAIVFDASGSMRQAVEGTQGDRWAEAQEIAATWMKHLSVEECVLIVFSSTVRTFPEDGTLADLRGEDGHLKREMLLSELKAVTPAGLTNTLDALRKAYEYDIDTILLFTDGAPSKADSGLFDAAIAEEIYSLCRQHQDIPINTIGLGNYFDVNMSTFLQTVAKISDGTFRGE